MKDLDLGVVMDRLVQGWRTPAVFAAVLVVCALIVLPTLKPVYSVHMLIIPAPTDQTSTTGSSGALSTILGLAGSGTQGSNYTRYRDLLDSTVVAQRMQNKYGMLQYVFKDYWDPKEHKWIEKHTLRQDMQAWLLRWSNLPVWIPPDTTALAQFLKTKLIVLPSTLDDIVDISMDDPDVAYATHIMLTAHEQANAVLRDQIARRASQQVAYLERKLAQTTVEDYRQTLLALLSSQEKTLMLTQTDASFAAEIISPPTASPAPVSPRPILMIFVAILVGAISGATVVIFFGPDWWIAPYTRVRTIYEERFGRRTRKTSVVT